MKRYLSPSILAADFTRLGEQVSEAEKAGATHIHLDVMDGMFVPNISFGVPVIESLKKNCNMIFDVHLMIEEPIRYVEVFKKAGADIITVHVEACSDVSATLDRIKELGAVPSLSINPDTDIEAVFPYLPRIGQLLHMTVRPGFGGQSFMPVSYDRLRRLNEIRAKEGYDFLLEVDGGITLSNLSDVLDTGVDMVVAGSSVFRGDITENVKKFLEVLG